MKQTLTLTRVEANYKLLSSLYKQGKFEDSVETTKNIENFDKFYYFPLDELSIKLESTSSQDTKLRGEKRNPRDLQWATRNLREQGQFLFAKYESFPTESDKSIILYSYRIISLSYEVDDYFLDVSDETSKFLIDLAEKVTQDIEDYVKQLNSYLPEGSEEYLELTKQILIVVLCGVNEFYRKHRHEDGLEKAVFVKRFLSEYPKEINPLKGHWYGLKGLCSFITGKLYTVLSRFAEAEQEFSESVEAYSESIWRKEQAYSQEVDKTKPRNKRFKQSGSKEHEISRSVALRRIGLVTSFGYAFQSLVIGKVKDAIYLSSVARGIVNWNTGKIWSAYVDLIYFSAKRAESSSNFDTLQEIKKKLECCYQVFVDFIPKGHYKNRALFQIALVNHYLARWHKEEGEKLEKSNKTDESLAEFKRLNFIGFKLK